MFDFSSLFLRPPRRPACCHASRTSSCIILAYFLRPLFDAQDRRDAARLAGATALYPGLCTAPFPHLLRDSTGGLPQPTRYVSTPSSCAGADIRAGRTRKIVCARCALFPQSSAFSWAHLGPRIPSASWVDGGPWSGSSGEGRSVGIDAWRGIRAGALQPQIHHPTPSLIYPFTSLNPPSFILFDHGRLLRP